MKKPINEVKRLQQLAGISNPSLLKEYTKDDAEAIKELMELLKQIQEKNKPLGALPIGKLDDMVNDLGHTIRQLSTMSPGENYKHWE